MTYPSDLWGNKQKGENSKEGHNHFQIHIYLFIHLSFITPIMKLYTDVVPCFCLYNHVFLLFVLFEQLKSLNSKTDISIFIHLRYLRLKMLKNKENNKKRHIFHHNFKNIPCFVMSEGIIEKVLFCSIWRLTYFKNFENGVYHFFKFKLFNY